MSQTRTILDALRTGPKTTAQLAEVSGSMAVHSRMAELAAKGYRYSKQQIATTASGSKVFEYTLLGYETPAPTAEPEPLFGVEPVANSQTRSAITGEPIHHGGRKDKAA